MEMMEDTMIRLEPKRDFKVLMRFVSQCRELRRRLDNAKTPEEVAEVEAELERVKRAFESNKSYETAVRM